MMHWGELAALLTAFLWTLSALAWTTAGRTVGALAVNFLRMIIACGFMLLYGRLVRGLWLPSDASLETWTVLGLSGFVGFFLADMCFFQALFWIGPRITLLFQSLSPPFAALITFVFLGESLPGRGWLAMGITVLGVVWVVLERSQSRFAPRPRRHLAGGMVLAVLAALGQAVGLVLSRHGMSGQYDAVAATFIRAAGAMIGFLPLITLTRAWPTMAAAARNRRVMLVLTLGAFVGPFAGVALCMYAVSQCHPGVVATIIATMPVLILPFVVVLYREKLSLRAVAGALISVAGVALLMLPGRPPQASAPAREKRHPAGSVAAASAPRPTHPPISSGASL